MTYFNYKDLVHYMKKKLLFHIVTLGIIVIGQIHKCYPKPLYINIMDIAKIL